MYKQFIKPVIILLAIALLVNSCEDDFFGSKSLEGQWGVVENSSLVEEATFIVYIFYSGEDFTNAEIENFSGLGEEVVVSLEVNEKSIVIPANEYRDKNNNTYIISGSGTISGNFRKINMSYFYDGINFTAEFTKQF